MKTFNIGGVHPHDSKLNADAPVKELPVPQQVCVMVSQHLGAPSQPIVKKGDKVKVGTVLTSNEAFLGAVVHSPVSGTVNKIADVVDASNYPKPAIFIDVEGDEWEDDIDRTPDIKREITLDAQEIIQRVKEKGIVGMGGACFPTHVKLMPPKDAKAEFLLLNGVECEPYLTCDYRLMLDHAEEIMIGATILMKALDVKQAIVGIEANKPKAIEHMSEIAKKYPGVSVQALKMKYPQGAEKQLIKALTGRAVPSGKLPINVGCVVDNVATCYAVYQAVQKNMPLIQRMVTVTGPCVSEPTNFLARLGSPVSAFLDAVGGVPENTGKVISGGPMMGKAIMNTEVSSVKGMSGILVLPEESAHRLPLYPCIRCGKCVEACPMGLEPYLIASTTMAKAFEQTEKAKVMDCIECGCCQFTCPANRPLLDCLKLGKATVGKIIRARNAK
ncbi:MAG: electron transport complex subunit RsxC [Bacteroidales bacterium]|nr:electron transport complex subunit RsxC [Bacteroidales bacterium]